ncbi:MAG: type II toxin-antitoxin system RelE/ParE family toxin [Pseudomonadota bacterium]
MYRIRILKKAKQDLSNIRDYIALDNPYRAISFTQEMLTNFSRKISIYPKSGLKCKDFYYSIYKNYLIFYDIAESEKEIVILHIVHSSNYTSYQNFI